MTKAQGASIELGSAYPTTAHCNELGHLEVGGCDVVSLADEFGTPLYVYDEATIRTLCREYVDSFGSRLERATIAYAGKSFLCRAMCELVAEEGLSLDVSSGGELWMARVAGFPAERICVHGNNKTAAELELALDTQAGRVIVDSFHELSLLESLAAARGRRQRVLLRLAPGVSPHTHKYMQTGHEGSKFGFPLDRAEEAVRRTLAAPHLDLAGLHFHIGSLIADLTPYRQAVAVIMGLIADLQRSLGFDCDELDIGGGLSVDYLADDRSPSVAEFAEVICAAVEDEAAARGLTVPHLLVEPGRSISGRAGLTAYRVGSIKDIPGWPLCVAVDGGMSDNMRPMLYGARYQAALAGKMTAEAGTEVRVVGKHCESGDVLIPDIRIPAVEAGDVLVMPTTGAYTYSMANNYNGQPRAAVVFVRDGEARVVVERETWADVARLHRPLHER